MKTIRVLDTLKIGNNTSVIVESKCEELRNGMDVLDSDNNIHRLLSVGMAGGTHNLDATSLLIKGKFNSGIIRY